MSAMEQRLCRRKKKEKSDLKDDLENTKDDQVTDKWCVFMCRASEFVLSAERIKVLQS